MSDKYRRIPTHKDGYRCGCAWVKDQRWGDVLVECAIHKQATSAAVSKHERESKVRP